MKHVRRPIRARSRWWSVIGWVLIGAGLLCGGYVLWEYEGTNWVSHREARASVQQLRAAWQRGASSAHTSHGTVGALVEIPRFGRSYEVPLVEGTDDSALAVGFGHFTGTAGPGDAGNFALAAHRVTHGEPLRGMPSLEVGDKVVIRTASTVFTYRLVTAGPALVVPMTDTWVTSPLPTNPEGGLEPPQQPGEHLLTLVTCSELFHTTNRMVAFGVLESSQPHE